MSLLLITNPPTLLAVAGDWTDFVARSDANMLGHGLSIPIFTLTNWDATTTLPEIAADSIIEVGGSFYQADVDTALTPEGGIIDGTVHIKLVPAGGGASVVPTLTNDSIPAWDANKAGWYATLDKFLPFEMTKATAVYTVKSEYIDQNKFERKIISSAGFNLAGDLAVTGDISATDGTFSSVDTGAGALKSKLLTQALASGGSKTIAHGLTQSRIKGISIAVLSSTLLADTSRVEASNVLVSISGSGSGTLNIIVFYI